MGAVKHVFLQKNSGAVFVVIVISAGDAIFAKFYKKCLKHVKLHICSFLVCCFFQESVVVEVCRRQRRARALARPIQSHGTLLVR